MRKMKNHDQERQVHIDQEKQAAKAGKDVFLTSSAGSWLPLLLLTGTVIFLLLFLNATTNQFQTAERSLGFDMRQPVMTDTDAGQMVDDVDKLISAGSEYSETTGENTWRINLATGRLAPADYLLRVFLSPDYLKQARDDAQFIQDVYQIVARQRLTSEKQQSLDRALQESGSRLALINTILEEQGHSDLLDLPEQTTRLRSVYFSENRPADGTEIVGRLRIDSEIRLTGPDGRMKLYANQQIRADQPLDYSREDSMQAYRISWNAHEERDGSYQLGVMILTNDGRGYWQQMEQYEVPVIWPLTAGQLRQDTLVAGPQVQDSKWYQLDRQQNAALLNIVSSEHPVQLELYDLDRQAIADTRSHERLPAALRYKEQNEMSDDQLEETSGHDDGQGMYFVKATPVSDAPGSGSFSYLLLPSLAAASPLQQPERFLAVHEIREQELLIEDETGRREWLPRDQYRLFDPTALLGSLVFSDIRQDRVEFVPAFSEETEVYALVVDERETALELDYQALEGSFADVEIYLETEQEGRQPLTSGRILLEPSVNTLELFVSGFDGRQNTYTITILRPPHREGFHNTLNPFHHSYRSWLWLLHLQQPDYQFEAMLTDIEWEVFFEAQTYRDRSLIDAAVNPDSWVRAGSPVYDGTSWKAASDPVVAYYADPRNFLDPVNIFQFESMAYEPQLHTRQGVEAILADTFMESGNPEGIDYAAILMDAAEVSDVSPFFLASKIIQEMGRLGQSPLAYGQVRGYEGFYNFYNINAIPNPDVPDGAQINGARFAQFGLNPDQGEISEQEAEWLIPWHTPERGIVGGAVWIADLYVDAGQDTLYVQKFDIIGADGLFMRQYAQNIQMAWAEGQRTYRAYEAMDLLDQPFVFRIPVFLQMPETPEQLP